MHKTDGWDQQTAAVVSSRLDNDGNPRGQCFVTERCTGPPHLQDSVDSEFKYKRLEVIVIHVDAAKFVQLKILAAAAVSDQY